MGGDDHHGEEGGDHGNSHAWTFTDRGGRQDVEVCESAGSGSSQPRASGSVDTGPINKLARHLFSNEVDPGMPATLSSDTQIAKLCGIPPSSFRDALCGLAHSHYNCALGQVCKGIRNVLNAVGTHGRMPGHDHIQPLLYVRCRKYDETPMRLRVECRSANQSGQGTDKASGPVKLFLTEARWAMALRKQVGGQQQVLTITGLQPSLLQVLESTTADVMVQALIQLDLPQDHAVRKSFFRCVDVAITDGAASNLRAERFFHRTTGRDVLHLLCDAHITANIIKAVFKVLAPWDTNLIRLALSVDGAGVQRIREEVRRLLEEQLVIYYGSTPSAEATGHRMAVYDCFLKGKSPDDCYRRRVIEGLWNGDLRFRGEVQHYEVGCCASREETLNTMINEGVRCIMPGRLHVMSRSNWTGCDKALRSIGLPGAIHGLLSAAYLRAFPEPKKQPQRGRRSWPCNCTGRCSHGSRRTRRRIRQ